MNGERREVERRRAVSLPRLGCAVLLLVLAGCQAGGPARQPVVCTVEPWTFGGAEGYRLTTEHYDIYTTLTDEVLRGALPDFVEGAYANYTQLVMPTRVPAERMRVYLFASRGQWAAFTRRFTGHRAKVFLRVQNGGYSEGGVSVIQYVSHSITFPLFAHEGWHQYLYHCADTRVPAWLNEGLAVCCEGQRWNEHGVTEWDPWFNPMRANALRRALLAGRLHALRTLLETHAGKVLQGSSEQVATYYAQVWALILFLQEGQDGKYAAKFARLLKQVGAADLEQHARAAYIWSERDTYNFGEALFRNFISDDLATVEQEYQAFMRARFLERR